MSDFQRQIRFEPGHTIRRSKGDGQNYGIAAMQMRFLLAGEHGTIQFLMSTGWYPEKAGYSWHHSGPSAWDLGAHWDTPWWEGMDDPENGWMHRDCDVRPNGRCWYDGSGLRADPVMEAFFLRGEDAVWALLEEEYRRIAVDALAIGARS